MKKYSIVAFAAILGTCLFYSCSKEADIKPDETTPAVEDPADNPQDPAGDAVMVFSASMGDSEETKTYLGAAESEGVYIPRWNSDDVIYVNGSASTGTVTRSNDNKDGSFAFASEVEPADGKFYAVSPSMVDDSWEPENKRYTVQVNGTGSAQVYVKYNSEYLTYHRNTAFIAACSNSQSLSFKQLMAYFKLTIIGGAGASANLKNIYIRQAGAEPNIAGNWYINFDGEGNPSMAPKKLTSIIAYSCVNAKQAADGLALGSTVLIAIPAHNYANGLILTIKDFDGKFQSFSIPVKSSDLSGKAGKIITKELTFNPQSGTINSAEDWEAFAAAVNGETNDWDLYKWVGNGTVKIGADISAPDLTAINNLKYTIDGQDHTITRTAATGALIGTISGEVKNLTLAGAIEANDAPQLGALANILDAGGKITNVTNGMTIEATAAADMAIGGIVRQIKGGSIEGCINNGSISANINVCDDTYACQVGGIVAGTSLTEGALIKDCVNNGTLTVTPTTDDNENYVQYGSIGGVIASISSPANKVILNNCDNAGEINWIGAHGFDSDANNQAVGRATATSIGGVLGRATPVSGSYPYLFSTPSATNGMSIEMINCDNSGDINGKAIGWYGTVEEALVSTTAIKQMHGKIYVGGLAGSLIGKESEYAVLTNCTNSGDVTPYDYTTEGSSYASSQCGLASVVGGLIGWGGYVTIDGGSTSGTIGTKERHCFALGGVIGFAVRPFAISDFTVGITGWFVAGKKTVNSSDTNLTGNNYAFIAATPAKFDGANLTCPPNVSGSTVTHCTVTGTISSTSNITFDKTSSQAGEKFNNRASDSSTNWVRGIGLTQPNTGVIITN